MTVSRSPDLVSWPMFLAAHRARSTRRRARVGRDRVLVFAPDEAMLRWIEHELFGERVTAQVVDSLVDVVTTLTLVPPPWPQLLILDVAAISPADLELLGSIRAAGWPGMVIAVGDPSDELRRALAIDVVLPRTYQAETLRTAIKHVGIDRPTVPLRRIAR